ncbi:hypothetical protein DX873_05040 [Flagellimonas nanhaiensis]|uniref:Uncharacterized protein n=2 Tax=Flagellimonas nanhaiensis TaxID=2292706 RepID=A0A371JUR7_9FLAO|nr:hypothetical protein DX873_05040 [Allomuricauda nanhaiensis]
MAQSNIETLDIYEESKKIGLVSYLTLIQHYAPQAVIYADKNIQDATAVDEVNKSYIFLTIGFNSLINQLSADMNQKNSPSRYKKLNTYLKDRNGNKKIENYYTLLELIEFHFMKLYYMNDGSSTQKIVGPDEALAFVGGVPYTIYKDFKAVNTAKVAALTTLLKELRLKSLSEILPKKGKE